VVFQKKISRESILIMKSDFVQIVRPSGLIQFKTASVFAKNVFTNNIEHVYVKNLVCIVRYPIDYSSMSDEQFLNQSHIDLNFVSVRGVYFISASRLYINDI